MMAVKEMTDMAVIMSRPSRRDVMRKQIEERIPVLQLAINEFKSSARVIRERMLSVSGGILFARAQDALSISTVPCILSRYAWGVDQMSLDETRAIIRYFWGLGYHSIAYVLLTVLSQINLALTQEDVAYLIWCKHGFVKEVEDCGPHNLVTQLLPRWKDCQLFSPKAITCVPKIAKLILEDDRPDILGRMNFHILADAGNSILWKGLDRNRSHQVARFEIEGIGTSAKCSVETINCADILGRSALHIAVSQGDIGTVNTLMQHGADMHQLCLNNLSLLHIAACQGHFHLVRHLASSNSRYEDQVQYLYDIDQLDGQNRTPLWYAARGSHMKIVRYLAVCDSPPHAASRLANVEHEDENGHSALAIAARDGRANVLEYLLGLRKIRGQSVSAEYSSHEYLLLAYALQSGSSECIQLVHRHREWGPGDTPFHDAWRHGVSNGDKLLLHHLNNLPWYKKQSGDDVGGGPSHRHSQSMTTLETLTRADSLWSTFQTWQ